MHCFSELKHLLLIESEIDSVLLPMSCLQVVTQEEAEAMQARGDLLLSEQACGHTYGLTKAAVQAVQYQDKVGANSLLHIVQCSW